MHPIAAILIVAGTTGLVAFMTTRKRRPANTQDQNTGE